ncbi:hypothetical protein FE257_009842 [Aspergillus nanangensis]|uniref:DUF6590 domain-containing protein n=1 Tax=Aspergillus nanangensis TaxID=2582783 RepID=A0AAD4CVV8_ASPNN|nr:hypothetical protein FE257_009842 [Aspergillus nanangensis]
MTETRSMTLDGSHAPSRLAIVHRFATTKPAYRNSFEEPEAFRWKTSFGTILAWRVKDRVSQIWSRLQVSLTGVLEAGKAEFNEAHHGAVRRGYTGTREPCYSIRCFLMGVDKDHARPNVVVMCDVEWCSKVARNIILASDLLNNEGWKCLRLPFSITQLGKRASDITGSGGGSAVQHTTPSLGPGYVDTSIPSLGPGYVDAPIPRQSYSAPYHPGFPYPFTDESAPRWRSYGYPPISESANVKDIGCYKIITTDSYEDNVTGVSFSAELRGQNIGAATIGGLVQVGDLLLGMTVGHVFHPPDGNGLAEPDFTPDEDELDLFDDDNTTTARGSLRWAQRSSNPLESSEDEIPDRPEPTFSGEKFQIGVLEEISSVTSASRYPLPDLRLDWALIRLNADHPILLRGLGVSDRPQNMDGVYRGNLSKKTKITMRFASTDDKQSNGCGTESTTVIKIPGVQKLQRVHICLLNSNWPRAGDCGCWALIDVENTRGSKFVGMLVASCHALNEVYILRAHDILDDIQRQTHQQVNIPATYPDPRRSSPYNPAAGRWDGSSHERPSDTGYFPTVSSTIRPGSYLPPQTGIHGLPNEYGESYVESGYSSQFSGYFTPSHPYTISSRHTVEFDQPLLREDPGPRHMSARVSSPLHTRISTSNTNSRLDSRYKVPPPAFFKPGRVFSILWHEAPGSTRQNQSYISEAIYQTRFDEQVYCGIRRMVVVKELAQCSLCFSIHTYGGRGVGKDTSDASKHAIIYMEGHRPVQGPNEPPLTKEPLEIRPVSADEKLDSMSRINFGKLYTVEHNVKVREVGRITQRSMSRFVDYARAEFAI